MSIRLGAPDIEEAPRQSRHQDAALHKARDDALRAAGVDPVEARALPKVTGTGQKIKVDPHARDCGPSVLSEEALAGLRAYVGQDQAIDGTWDPMTCTLTKPDRDPNQADPTPEDEEPGESEESAEVRAARLKKAEKARKKRERKKAAKREAQGKGGLTFGGGSQLQANGKIPSGLTFGGGSQLQANGKIPSSAAGTEREGWHRCDYLTFQPLAAPSLFTFQPVFSTHFALGIRNWHTARAPCSRPSPP